MAELTGEPSIDHYFPEDEANALARLESYNKHLFRPNSYLHKWWARRSGTTFRYLLKQLAPDRHLRDYYCPGGLEGVTILDPMIGGGTTLHEAIRLGANVIGYDIDPIPILQAKASLADIDPYEKQAVFKDFLQRLKSSLSEYFQTKCPKCHVECETQFVLYGVRKLFNGTEVVVIDSFILRFESNGKHKRFEDLYPSRQFKCGKNCWEVLDKDNAKERGINGKGAEKFSISFNERYVPLVIVGYCKKHEGFFKAIEETDLLILEKARKSSAQIDLPALERLSIPHGPKSDDLLNRGVSYFHELFFPRQLLYLGEAKSLLNTLPKEHIPWMSLLISTSLEFNSALCGYKGAEVRRPGAVRHVFSHHAYSFPYTSLENNPVFSGKTSGTLGRLFDTRIFAASKWARAPIERHYSNGKWEKTTILNESDIGHECSSISSFVRQKKLLLVKQIDSSMIPLPDNSVDFVVTDPPYLDSVQYSDLSHFFRCWLRWFLPKHADWNYLATSSAVAETKHNEQKFGEVLTKIWQGCNRVLIRPHGRLIFTYHHWRASGWVQLSIALSEAKFRLINAYVVHSENPISVHIMNLKALEHDTILVLKPIDESNEKRWRQPEPVRLDDSYSFCKGCAQMLGWVLDHSLCKEMITEVWENFLKDSNGKISI